MDCENGFVRKDHEVHRPDGAQTWHMSVKKMAAEIEKIKLNVK